MQTFLPYEDFRRSAEVLDSPRLGKQRVETLQILRALVVPDYGWQSHPVTRMWMGYVPALTLYGLAMTDTWVARGYADTVRDQLVEFAPDADVRKVPLPPWLGDARVHESHQSNLLAKDPVFYADLFPGTPPDLPYVWPEPETEPETTEETTTEPESTETAVPESSTEPETASETETERSTPEKKG